MSIGQTQAVQGIQRSEAQFDRAAAGIAQGPSSSSSPHADIVDLSALAVAMMEAKNSFEANTKVFKADNQMQQALLNVVG